MTIPPPPGERPSDFQSTPNTIPTHPPPTPEDTRRRLELQSISSTSNNNSSSQATTKSTIDRLNELQDENWQLREQNNNMNNAIKLFMDQ